MGKNTSLRKDFIHLYDPKKEGIGSYDVNYINGYQKERVLKAKIKKLQTERYAA